MRLFLTVLLLSASWVMLTGAFSELGAVPMGSAGKGDDFNFFDDHGTLTVVLKTDLWNLIRNPQEDQFQAAVFSLSTADSAFLDYPIQLRARGISRRNICSLPPLLLRFEKNDSLPPEIQYKGDLKLVSYCQNKPGFEDWVLKEYLAYRFYNLITEYSLRVRLLHITYVDENDRIGPIVKYGFLIEDIDEMAKRLDCREQNVESIPFHRLHQNQATYMDVFQYMIGNTDWSVRMLHNVKLILPRDTSVLLGSIPVPYDFDYSGFVNTAYAVPNPDLGIESVTERLFRGICRTPEEFRFIFDQFLNKKEAVLQLIEEMEPMGKAARNYCRRYVEEFYQILENPRSAEASIVRQCRQ
jgi:hypothetical protein